MANAKPSDPSKADAGETAVKRGLTKAEIDALSTPKRKPKAAAEAPEDGELTKPKPLTAQTLAGKKGGEVIRHDGREFVRDIVDHKSGPIIRHTFMDSKKA